MSRLDQLRARRFQTEPPRDEYRAALTAQWEARKAAMAPVALPRLGRQRKVKQKPAFYGPAPAIGTIFNVRVYGEPKGQPRMRDNIIVPKDFDPKNLRSPQPCTAAYTPDTANDWKAAVKRAFGRAGAGGVAPIDTPIRCSIDFLMPRPKYLCEPWYLQNDPGERPYLATPDRDNMDKAVLDALTDFGLWRDDSLVFTGLVQKFYHAVGDEPGARIVVEILPPAPTPPKRMAFVEPTGLLFTEVES